MGVAMPKGFDLRCGAGKTARVWLQGKGGELRPGQALVLLPLKRGENESSPAGYLAPLRQALIDTNKRHVNLRMRERLSSAEAGYRAFAAGGPLVSTAPLFLFIHAHDDGTYHRLRMRKVC
jgi:hypothetical protein